MALVIVGLGLVSCQREDRFRDADKDGNGLLSNVEFSNYTLRAIFAQADANSDGQVTFEEWTIINPNAKKNLFLELDADRNSSVSFAEAEKHFKDKQIGESLFRDIDSNKDGGISRDEAAAYLKEMEAKAASLQTKNN